MNAADSVMLWDRLCAEVSEKFPARMVRVNSGWELAADDVRVRFLHRRNVDDFEKVAEMLNFVRPVLPGEAPSDFCGAAVLMNRDGVERFVNVAETDENVDADFVVELLKTAEFFLDRGWFW